LVFSDDLEGIFRNWYFIPLKHNVWKLKYIATSDNLFVLTGNDPDTIEVNIPDNFRLIRIDMYFSDTTSKSVKIHRTTHDPNSTSYQELAQLLNDVSRTLEFDFGEGNEFEAGIIELRITGTNGKSVKPLVYVQRLK